MRERIGSQRGFTLPEFIVAGSMLLIFVVVALVLVRPISYDIERRDAKRRTDVARILQAVNAYKAEHGMLPARITAEETVIASEEIDNGLCLDLVPAYLSDLPLDPTPTIGLKDMADKTCDDPEQLYLTGYTIYVTDAGVVVVAAPAAESGEIFVIR